MPLHDPVQEQAVSHYIQRLLSAVNQSAILKAFPTQTIKRIDLARLRIAQPEAPERLVETLVRPEERYRLVFRDYRQSDDRGARSQALLTALRTKLARMAGGPGGVGPSQLGEPTHKTPVDRVFFELRTVNWPSKWPS